MWYENLNILSAIGLVIVALVVVGVLLFKGKKEEAKKIALALVIEAEQKFGAGTGSLKFAYVTGAIYPKLPIALRLFITEASLNQIIEESVDLLKKELQPATVATQTPIKAPGTVPVEEVVAVPVAEKAETQASTSMELGVVEQPVNEIKETPIIPEIPVDNTIITPVVIPSAEDIKTMIDLLVSSKVSDAVDTTIDIVSSQTKADTVASIVSGIQTA